MAPGWTAVARPVRDRRDFKVSEIWESEEQLRAFGEQLMPLLNEVGVQVVGEPEVFEVHVLEQPQTTG